MALSGWLRTNAEHYLLVDAHRRLAGKYGSPPPRKPHGAKEIFWLKIFAPLYGVLPWSVRHRVMRAMPVRAKVARAISMSRWSRKPLPASPPSAASGASTRCSRKN